jgi:hypothetical protein
MLTRKTERLRELAAELDRIAGGPRKFRRFFSGRAKMRPAVKVELADAIERAFRERLDGDEADYFGWTFPGGDQGFNAFLIGADELRRARSGKRKPAAAMQGELFPEDRT